MALGALKSSSTWRRMGVSPSELRLDFTLPTGQTFRWRKSTEGIHTGVIGGRVLQLRQTQDDVFYRTLSRAKGQKAADDSGILRDYFNLDTSLVELSKDWASRDERYKAICPYFPGARVLRQDPLECLFEFICSSNNHISRIQGMVERLCTGYGSPLLDSSLATPKRTSTAKSVRRKRKKSEEAVDVANTDAPQTKDDDVTAKENDDTFSTPFYAFPTLEQLSSATEEDLRASGFGYRAKYITGSVEALLSKEGGGINWLYNLRTAPYKEASKELCTLPGVGPKVAACVCLFSLDKHEAIPVDTHVWQVAKQYYTPELSGKSLTKQVMETVENAFIERFGEYAGWAHNCLFIAELAEHSGRFPEELRTPSVPKAKRNKAKKGKKA